MQEHAAVVAQVVGEQDLEGAEGHGDRGARHRRVEVDPGRALILGVDVLFAGGVVELAVVGADEDVVVAPLAEVDLGARHLEGGDLRLRRDVVEEQLGEALVGGDVHRAEGDPVAVGEGEVLVDPRAVRQAVGVELAG